MQQSTYTVEEGESVEVCAQIIGLIERIVNITINTIDDTDASGKSITNLANPFIQYHGYHTVHLSLAASSDFLPVTESLSFIPSGSQQKCINISIPQDRTVENNESFSVVVNSSDQDVVLASSEATVIIIDEDSK